MGAKSKGTKDEEKTELVGSNRRDRLAISLLLLSGSFVRVIVKREDMLCKSVKVEPGSKFVRDGESEEKEGRRRNDDVRRR